MNSSSRFAPLPEWQGDVIKTLFRCSISQSQLASEMGVCRQYLNKLMNSPDVSIRSRGKVEAALKTLVEKKGLLFEDVYPVKERPG